MVNPFKKRPSLLKISYHAFKIHNAFMALVVMGGIGLIAMVSGWERDVIRKADWDAVPDGYGIWCSSVYDASGAFKRKSCELRKKD